MVFVRKFKKEKHTLFIEKALVWSGETLPGLASADIGDEADLASKQLPSSPSRTPFGSVFAIVSSPFMNGFDDGLIRRIVIKNKINS